MGVMTENAILTQLKRGQGETNERLDRIVALLETLVAQRDHVEPAPRRPLEARRPLRAR